jgi:hypothetical protein
LLQTNALAHEKRGRAIDVIERNAVAQNQLIEDLLDMSRITTGKVRLDLEPVPAVTPLQNALEAVKPAAVAKGIELRPDLDLFAGSVAADTARLQQVFSTLLTNAVKFTDQGGRIVTSLRRDGTFIEVAVSDTGVGISAEFLPFVFEPFRQADSHLHRGLGLGLAISKQLVDLHGGTIQALSEGPGRGASFIVRLPRVSGETIGMIDETIALGLDTARYFNSGVLLIDLEAWRDAEIGRALLELGHQRAAELEWADQDGLNLLLADRRLELHPRWNAMNSLWAVPGADATYAPDAAEEARRRPAIRHFEGPDHNKPWHRRPDIPSADLYHGHRAQTPWPVRSHLPARAWRAIRRRI